jgi:hypothetical protein
MFTRNSFDSWSRHDPAQFARKAAKPTRAAPRGGAIGSATPRTDHGVAMKPAKEVM